MPSFANVFAVHSVPLSLRLQTLQDARQLFVVLAEFAEDGLQRRVLIEPTLHPARRDQLAQDGVDTIRFADMSDDLRGFQEAARARLQTRFVRSVCRHLLQ